eukprot:833525-Pelagomonas_calceolata.AAC.6
MSHPGLLTSCHSEDDRCMHRCTTLHVTIPPCSRRSHHNHYCTYTRTWCTILVTNGIQTNEADLLQTCSLVIWLISYGLSLPACVPFTSTTFSSLLPGLDLADQLWSIPASMRPLHKYNLLKLASWP